MVHREPLCLTQFVTPSAICTKSCICKRRINTYLSNPLYAASFTLTVQAWPAHTELSEASKSVSNNLPECTVTFICTPALNQVNSRFHVWDPAVKGDPGAQVWFLFSFHHKKKSINNHLDLHRHSPKTSSLRSPARSIDEWETNQCKKIQKQRVNVKISIYFLLFTTASRFLTAQICNSTSSRFNPTLN